MDPHDDVPSPAEDPEEATAPRPADREHSTPSPDPTPERPDMTTHPPAQVSTEASAQEPARVPEPSGLQRFLVPALCLLMTSIAAFWGERILVIYAGQAAMGPLLAEQVAVMVAVGFMALTVVTLLLALFPGTDASGPEPETFDSEDTPELTLAEAGEQHPRDAIVEALKKTATKATAGRLAAEARADAAEARAEQLDQQLAEFRAGTSPDAKSLRKQIREEEHRDALGKVRELGEASERLAATLKDGKARAEADLRARTAELEALRASLPALHREAAAEERRRAMIALKAVTEAAIKDFPPAHAEALTTLAARLVAALDRLDHDTPPAPGEPGVPACPPQARTGGVLSADPEPPSPETKKKSRRGRSR